MGNLGNIPAAPPTTPDTPISGAGDVIIANFHHLVAHATGITRPFSLELSLDETLADAEALVKQGLNIPFTDPVEFYMGSNLIHPSTTFGDLRTMAGTNDLEIMVNHQMGVG